MPPTREKIKKKEDKVDGKLIIPYQVRKDLVKRLSLVPEIAASVVEMGLSMEIHGRDREVELSKYLRSVNISSYNLKSRKAPSCIVDDPVWQIFGWKILRLVKKELVRREIRFAPADVILISFLIANLIINGEDLP